MGLVSPSDRKNFIVEVFSESLMCALAGLLHDLDWEITKETPEKHPLMAVEILEKENFPQEVILTIKKHNHLQGLTPETKLEKALYSCEEITGLIVAVALVMPNKKLSEVTVERNIK